MRYVCIRDDDTNALTPIECLETMYRPFLDRGLPVNLAVIPEVATDTRLPDGTLESFITGERAGEDGGTAPIGSNPDLVEYLLANPLFHLAQHGLSHGFIDGRPEFEQSDASFVGARLDRGLELFEEAGLPRPVAFVAPQDKMTRASIREVARRFDVVSAQWYERGRMPVSWWPSFIGRKFSGRTHWRAAGTRFLVHPGCDLQRNKSYSGMLDAVKRSVMSDEFTVVVTHWNEYFVDGRPDVEYLGILQRVGDWLAEQSDIQVITFADVARDAVPSA